LIEWAGINRPTTPEGTTMSQDIRFITTDTNLNEIGDIVTSMYGALAGGTLEHGAGDREDACFPDVKFEAFTAAMGSLGLNDQNRYAVDHANEAALEAVLEAIQAGVRWGAIMAASMIVAGKVKAR
jgi:hypothetical protein